MKIRISILVLFICNLFFAQNYHDTQGKLEISNSGQATYTLPIAMPPSIGSVGPTINLVYASGRNGGIAGQGWNINSISALCRIATRQDIDGFKDGVDFDDNDKLALDGQRLLLKTGTYWADGSTYETEVQSNTKIELKGSGDTMFFIVTAPDGSRSWYGNYNGAHAIDLTAWYIVRYEDANRNFVIYNYAKPFNKSLCIDTIQFSANTNTNTTPLNYIKFGYTTAARTESTYIKGILVEHLELLNNIKVFTSNNGSELLFREYRISFVTDGELGYHRIRQIQEFNGAGEATNPVLFEYKSTPNTVFGNDNQKAYVNSINFNDVALTGDFDGDSKTDFVVNNNIYTKIFDSSSTSTPIAFSGITDKRHLLSAITLKNNQINQKHSIVGIEETMAGVQFKVQTLNSSNTNLILEYSKNESFYNEHTIYSICNNDTIPVYSPSVKRLSNKYIEGDFNGDGISEILIMSYPESTIFGHPQLNTDINRPVDPNPCNTFESTSSLPDLVRILDLNPNASEVLNTLGNVEITGNINKLIGDKHFVMDFNLDGRADIFCLQDNGFYQITSLKQLSQAPWYELETIGYGWLDKYDNTKQMLWGDFNGDSKPDILLPEASGNGCEGCNLWHIYYGNPKVTKDSYFEKQSLTIDEYWINQQYHSQTYSNSFYAMDVNNDGKTDVVRYEARIYITDEVFDAANHNTQWTLKTWINNIGKTGTNGFTSGLLYNNNSNHSSLSPWLPIPIPISYKYLGKNNDFVVIREHTDNYIEFINFSKDVAQDNLMTKISSCNGKIVDTISYLPMDGTENNGLVGNGVSFYSTEGNLQYPLIEIKRNPNNFLVKTHWNSTLGITRKQNFKYKSYVIDLSGIGSVGFKKVARSGWYHNSADKRIWIITENDPTMRGATISTKNFMLPISDDFDFNATYSTLFNKTENEFHQSAAGVFPYWILLDSQSTTDYLTNVIKKTEYLEYTTPYFLPRKVKTSNYLDTTLEGSTLTETEYDSNDSGTGRNYYIGRPVSISTTSTAYGKLKKSMQTLDYTNGNIWHNIKQVYVNDSTTDLDPVSMVETMTYYPNGLLKDKEVSATGTTTNVNEVTPRKISYTYDPTNRFISSITDAEGLVTTNDSFDPLYGTVLQTTNPFNQTTTSVYDHWGKCTSITDNTLHLTTHYDYSRVDNTYKTTVTKTTTNGVSDGSSSFVEQDVLAREIRKGSKNLNGVWTYVNTEYDIYGRKQQTSEPYFEGDSPNQWTVYDYDDYSRPIKVTSFTRKEVNTTYDGLTVTVEDSVTIKKKTIDSNGQVVKVTDHPGGDITYSYDASGNLLESNYEGISTTMQYDNWGRKIQLADTSSGTYTYSYNAYGEILTEEAPKGITTYTYDGLSGRVKTKSIVGLTPDDGTNITNTYDYNPSTKLLERILVENPNDGGSSTRYTYDTQRRLTKTEETQNLLPDGTAVFTKELNYDIFSRVDVETNTATAFGKTSTKAIKHSYSANGTENQLKDNETSENLWWANSVDARGNILKASLGNGIAITNTFDEYGYASQFQHLLANNNVMTLNTSFDPILGNLKSRYNSMFDVTEHFAYDELDRLISWDSNVNTQLLLPFNTTTDGFTFIKSTTSSPGFVSNVAGTMKVYLNQGAAVRDLNEIPAVADNVFHIKATITGKTAMSAVVNVVMVETDPDNSNNTNEVILGVVENGTFEADYATTNSVSDNPKLKFKFVIDDSNNGLLPINGGTPQATFYVDNLKIDRVVTTTQQYDNRGRITNNKNGYYNYSDTHKPYQNTSIVAAPDDPLGDAFAKVQNITYNAFKAPIQIVSAFGNTAISFGYNDNEQRSVMYYGSNDANKLDRPYRRYYSADGSMEITAAFAPDNLSSPEKIEFLTYVGGSAYSAPVIIKSTGEGAYNYFYLHRDYQNSILAITNDHGDVVEKRLFDPWGAIVRVYDGAGNSIKQLTFFDRGYTGHEHLQSVGLINMNARLYNPTLHRFLSADNFVQDPYNTQSYNRYGYCVNNPLKYTDVTGNLWGMGELLSAVVIGVIISAVTYSAMCITGHAQWNFKGGATAIVTGAVSGAITFGIGSWAESAFTNFYSQASFQAIMHGAFQGTMSTLQGGAFWSGFAAGAVSSIVCSFMMGGNSTEEGFDQNNNWAYTRTITHHQGFAEWAGVNKTVGTLAAGAISGGAAASLTGGNFWQGAVTGLIVAGLNHLMHGDNDPPGKKKKSNYSLRKYEVEKGEFFGAEVKFDAFQWGKYTYNNTYFGTIHTSMNIYNNYLVKGLNSKAGMLMMHEYGHFLHAQYATLNFYSYAIWSSAATANFSWSSSNWTEITANTMSYYYFGQPTYWDIQNYPINPSYLSQDLKYKLTNHIRP